MSTEIAEMVDTTGRWPLIAGNLKLRCVGILIMCPYMAGGRSRRGSPKAGTTVCHSFHALQILVQCLPKYRSHVYAMRSTEQLQ